MVKPKVAAQLYTLREFLKTPEDIAKSLRKVREIGYRAIQVSGVGPIDPVELKKIADAEGLKICATHISFESMQNDLESVIAKHKLWECEYAGVGSMPGQYKGSREGFARFAKEASVIARKLADNGLKFIYHNHNFEFIRFGEETGMDVLLKESDPEVFGFEIDTYWVQAGGANPVDWINKVKGRMKVVHFKDMGFFDGKQVMAEVGEGNMNWQAIISACSENQVEWAAVEQDVCLRDPFESLAISLKNLKKFGLE